MKHLSFFLFILMLVASCTDTTTVDLADGQASDNMPNVASWKYYGIQQSSGKDKLMVELSFVEGISASVRYGVDLNEKSSSEHHSLLWKMVDGTVYMYLDKTELSQSERPLYMEGKIIDDNRYLEVSWNNGLGSLWDAKAGDNAWEDRITLELVEFKDFGWGYDVMWYPWNIPGFVNTYEELP